MNIVQELTDYSYLESRYYRIFIDSHFSYALDRFAIAADDRLEKIKSFFGGLSAFPKQKSIYFISSAEKNCGKAFADGHIECFFDRMKDPSQQLIPFVHEETHIVIAQLFGTLPSFWNEGIAEFMTIFLNENKWDEKQLKILDINLTLSSQMISKLDDMVWTMNDELYRKYRKRYITGHVFAAVTVNYLINKYGKETCFFYIRDLTKKNTKFFDLLRDENVFVELLDECKKIILQGKCKDGIL